MKRNSSVGSENEAEKKAEGEKKTEKAKVETELKLLQDLTPGEVAELQAVCADAEVMRFVGDSKPWTPARVEELCAWARKDAAAAAASKTSSSSSSDSKVEYWHWALVERAPAAAGGQEPPAKRADTGTGPARAGTVVGYVGLRPVPRARQAHTLQVRVFVARAHQGRGHARRALAHAARHVRTALPWCPELDAFVRADNAASAALFAACGWQRGGVKWFGRERETVFVCPLTPAPRAPGSSPPRP